MRYGALVTALLVTTLSARADTAPHGATGMAEQQAELRALDPVAPERLPVGVDGAIWDVLVPEGNEVTQPRVALGQKLYFEPRLSADGTVACATCHDVTRSFTDRRNVSEGIKDQLGRRNAPTTLNAALLRTQFWDGRAATLEVQAGLPILNPVEMGQPDKASAVRAIADDAEYQKLFAAAYGSKPNYQDIERAIAAFERTLIFLDAPFDRFLAGDTQAISADARAGWELFNGKGRCATCHPINSSNPVGTDHNFHNIGVAARTQDFEAKAAQALGELGTTPDLEKVDRLALETNLSELGRFMVTLNRSDIGSFKTSQLRNIGITAPYMHDGSMQTLWDVMDHYNKGGEANPYLDGGIEPLALTETEINQVVAFLFTLTDRRFADLNQQEMSKQAAQAKKSRPFRDEELAMRKKIQFEDRVFRSAVD